LSLAHAACRRNTDVFHCLQPPARKLIDISCYLAGSPRRGVWCLHFRF
jgi:hypothetical protein